MLRWFLLYFLLIVLLLTIKEGETQIIDTLFDMVEPEQSIMGRVGAKKACGKTLSSM